MNTSNLLFKPMLDLHVKDFSGSYAPDDVQLLIEEVSIAHTSVEEKEYLIQTGQKHYSDMISLESAPSDLHQDMYASAVRDGVSRVAKDIQSLALALVNTLATRNALIDQNAPIVLVSLIRAGLPIGVMLKHALTDLGQRVVHYGVSIVRDRGLDPVAYAYIRSKHAFAQLIFVDGWTGKGAISQQLQQSLTADPNFDGVVRLVTLADVAGNAWLTASGDDWLIPSGILGSTVSGLISRTIYRHQQLHGYVMYHHLAAFDQSQVLVNQVNVIRRSIMRDDLIQPAVWHINQRQAQQQQAKQAIAWVKKYYQVNHINLIKPSIAEATRVLMRRMPERVLVRNLTCDATRLLRHLAQQQGAPIDVVGDSIAPYHAISLIKTTR